MNKYNYVVHSSEQASELVVDTKLKPCTPLVHKGVTFSRSTAVCEIVLSHIGKNSGDSDLVCKNRFSQFFLWTIKLDFVVE